MALAQVNGTEIYYEIVGEGEPVVLIPGLGQGINYYDYAMTHLSPFMKVIALELRGNGRSAKPEGPYTMELWAEDISALLDALGEKRAHIVGSSLGGCVAMALVTKHPEQVASLALVAAFSELDCAWEMNLRMRMAIVEQVGINSILEDHVTLWVLSRDFLETEHGMAAANGLRQGLRRNTPALYNEFLRAILHFGRVLPGQEGQATYTHLLSTVDIPTILIVGENDIQTPVSFSQKIQDAMPKGRAELKIIPACGHVTFVEQPEENSRLVVEFIERVKKNTVTV